MPYLTRFLLRADYLAEIEVTVCRLLPTWSRDSPKLPEYYSHCLQTLQRFIEKETQPGSIIVTPYLLNEHQVETIRRSIPSWDKIALLKYCLDDILRVLKRKGLLDAPRPRIVLRTPRRLVVHQTPQRLALWPQLNSVMAHWLKQTVKGPATLQVNPDDPGDRRKLEIEEREVVCSAMFALITTGGAVRDWRGNHLAWLQRTDINPVEGVLQIPLRNPMTQRTGQQTSAFSSNGPTRVYLRVRLDVVARILLNRFLIFDQKWGTLLGHPPSDPHLFPQKYRDNLGLFASWLHTLITAANSDVSSKQE